MGIIRCLNPKTNLDHKRRSNVKEETTNEIESEVTSVELMTATVTEIEVTEAKITDAVKPGEASEVDNLETNENEAEK